jgi:hypothetical protein
VGTQGTAFAIFALIGRRYDYTLQTPYPIVPTCTQASALGRARSDLLISPAPSDQTNPLYEASALSFKGQGQHRAGLGDGRMGSRRCGAGGCLDHSRAAVHLLPSPHPLPC